MTESEAIELVNKLYANITSSANNIIKTDDYIEFVRIAINAVEKQIPKKVNLRHIRKYDGFDDGECPNCGMSVSRDCDGDDVFCPDCGQKLDWSDDE